MSFSRLMLWIVTLLSTAVGSIGAQYENHPVDQAIAHMLRGEVVGVEALRAFPVEEVTARIRGYSHYPEPPVLGGWVKLEHTITDTLIAPAYLWVPSSYDHLHPTPLFIYLHGGVSRPQFPLVEPSALAEEEEVKWAEQEGWLFLFPLGRAGCTWWDATGMAHLRWLLREVKRSFNVDDDRVVLGGFSDGGSAAYLWAMTDPTPFAFFIAWSGHPAVGSLAGPYQQYLSNLSVRPLYATFGGRDRLYPAERMLPIVEQALRAGGQLWVTVYDTAGHNGGYLKWEYPLLAKRMREGSRGKIPSKLYWEREDLTWRGVEWLEITELDTAQPPAPWHTDYNLQLTDDRLTIGFRAGEREEGTPSGIKVAAVMDDPDYPAASMGLKINDLIVAFDETPVASLEELERAKSRKKRGDSFILRVIREGEEVVLEGRFPPPRTITAFRRERASGAVRGYWVGNRFIIEASRVKAGSIYIAPEMIRWDQPVEVIVNGVWVKRELVQPDIVVLWDRFQESLDRQRLWWARVEWKKP